MALMENLPSRIRFDAGMKEAYEDGRRRGADQAHTLHAELSALDPISRKRRLKELDREIAQTRRTHADSQRSLARLQGLLDAHDELSLLVTQMRMEAATSSVLHRLRQSLGSAFFIATKHNLEAVLTPPARQEYDNIIALAHAFVVQHDWAAAFRNAGDYENDIFRLPFETCAFEFRVSGHAVIILATEADNLIYLQLAAETRSGWFSYERAVSFHERLECKYPNGEPSPIAELINFLRPQIKAISVALDADVAEIEAVRAPHKLNAARARAGRPPISDYHVISLASRERIKRLHCPQQVGARRRLHFRRGHWRHFEAYKTWIRWTLVGDPDLGFVDKEYRL